MADMTPEKFDELVEMLSKHSGEDILRAAALALENVNYHKESEVLDQMIGIIHDTEGVDTYQYLLTHTLS